MSIENYIQNLVFEAVSKAGFKLENMDDISVLEPKQKGHGDLAVNIALVLASKEKKNPREIARTIYEKLDLNARNIAKVEIAGPGFINFTLSAAYLQAGLRQILDLEAAYGRNESGKNIKTQVEFVSANPTGPLTIGHGRQAVLGDTVARLLAAAGYDVTREYYFNDAGRQMRMLGESVLMRYKELLGDKIELSENHYQGEYIIDIAKTALAEKGDSLRQSEDIEYFKKLAETAIFSDIKATTSRLGINFDVFFNEKSLYETGKIQEVIDLLKKKDLVYESEGATWFRTSQLGQAQDKVIVKSTGEPTYRLPDMAYHRDKLARGFEKIVDVFGSDHVASYPDVLAGLEAMDLDSSRVEVLIHQFVTLMEGNEKVKMSTRKANFVTLDELMDDVGVDVTRYFFLNRSVNSHCNFDLKLARTQSDENPVYYVQYAHARICSILRHAESEGVDLSGEADLALLSTKPELDMMRILLNYPDVVARGAAELEVHKVPSYLEEVATVYHRFQHAGKVDSNMRVVTEDEALTRARVALCSAAQIVLANGLELLGISRPEKM